MVVLREKRTTCAFPLAFATPSLATAFAFAIRPDMTISQALAPRGDPFRE
jgi:hypothetical protein